MRRLLTIAVLLGTMAWGVSTAQAGCPGYNTLNAELARRAARRDALYFQMRNTVMTDWQRQQLLNRLEYEAYRDRVLEQQLLLRGVRLRGPGIRYYDPVYGIIIIR